jgi:L-serine deaminase
VEWVTLFALAVNEENAAGGRVVTAPTNGAAGIVPAVKAITAVRMALRGDGRHHVSLDKVIKTMRETGADMKDKYKETARGGLAVNIIEC